MSSLSCDETTCEQAAGECAARAWRGYMLPASEREGGREGRIASQAIGVIIHSTYSLFSQCRRFSLIKILSAHLSES